MNFVIIQFNFEVIQDFFDMVFVDTSAKSSVTSKNTRQRDSISICNHGQRTSSCPWLQMLSTYGAPKKYLQSESDYIIIQDNLISQS